MSQYSKTGGKSYQDIYGITQEVKMSDIREFYGLTGPVSLNADLNNSAGGTIPNTNPNSGSNTSMGYGVVSNGRKVAKIGATQVITSGTSWSSRETASTVAEYSIHLTGAGASGGGVSTNQQREGISSGGGGGGSALIGMVNTDFANSSSPSATISIGAGGSFHTYAASSNSGNSGYNGGNTTWTHQGSYATNVRAYGGYRGFKSRQGPYDATAGQVTSTQLAGTAVGEGSTAVGSSGSWGQAATGFGRGYLIPSGGSGGTGGDGPGGTIGSDGKRATSGGSPAMGQATGLQGGSASSSGYTAGVATNAPGILAEWETDLSTDQFKGGNCANHSSGAAGTPTIPPGYGGGSGSSTSESGAGAVHTGGSGLIAVTYYGLTFNDTFRITTSQQELNLATWLTSQGWNGTDAISVTVVNGVYIWSDDTATAGLTIPSSLNGLLTLRNNGYIIGKGGQGGYRNANDFGTGGGDGEAGGPAISNSATGVTLINGYGAYIAGGGGGGGGDEDDADDAGSGGGGAGGGNGGAYPDRRASPGYDGPGGAIGQAGSNGFRTGNGRTSGSGGGAGGGGGAANTTDGGGGGGGGRILPGTGGAGGPQGDESHYEAGSDGGSAGNAGGDTNTGRDYGGGGGGGGWGARGGNVTTADGTSNGGAGGAAISGTAVSLTNSGTIYGSVA